MPRRPRPPETQIAAPPPAAVPAPVSQRVEATPPKAQRQPQSPGNNWFVVVATYAQKKDAEKRAQTMAGRWKRFKIEVYEPPVQKPSYVVVIGSNLSQKAATALQERARSAGLARDAFITRFSR